MGRASWKAARGIGTLAFTLGPESGSKATQQRGIARLPETIVPCTIGAINGYRWVFLPAEVLLVGAQSGGGQSLVSLAAFFAADLLRNDTGIWIPWCWDLAKWTTCKTCNSQSRVGATITTKKVSELSAMLGYPSYSSEHWHCENVPSMVWCERVQAGSTNSVEYRDPIAVAMPNLVSWNPETCKYLRSTS